MRQRIDGLGSGGLNSDVAGALLPPNVCTRLVNVIPQEGSLHNAVGQQRIRSLAVRPVYHTAWVSPTGVQFIVVSDGTIVHAYELDWKKAPEVILPPESAWGGGRVTFTSLNGVLVINSESDGPFYWPGPRGTSPEARELVPLPGWDPTWRCREIVAYRYHLVALGIREAENFFPHKVRWSTFAQEGDIPGEWLPTKANEAGSDILGETPGWIMGGRPIRDKLFIVKEDAVYEMRWIGGQYVMQLSRLQGTVGTTAPNGFTELGGALVVMSSTDLLLFDGQEQRSISDGRVRNAFFNTLSEAFWEKAAVFYYPPANMLYLAAAEAGYDRLSYAVVFNASEGVWGHRKLNYGYGFDIGYASLVSGGQSYDAQTPEASPPYDNWGPDMGPYDKGLYQPSVPDLIAYESNAADNEWWISFLSVKPSRYDETPVECTVERLEFPLEGSDGVAMIKGIWFDMTFDGRVQVEVGAQQHVGGPIQWTPPMWFGPGQDPYVDPRITGRYISWRVTTYDMKPWSLAALTIDWERAGER